MREWNAAMPTYHPIAAGKTYLAMLFLPGGRGEYEPVDAVRRPMHDRKATTTNSNVDTSRKPAHPFAVGLSELTAGVRVPRSGKPVAVGSLGEAATTIVPAPSERLLAVAHDHVNAPVADQGNRRRRVRAIGDHVAGADGPLWRNTQPVSLDAQCAGSLAVAVAAAEQQHGPGCLDLALSVLTSRQNAAK